MELSSYKNEIDEIIIEAIKKHGPVTRTQLNKITNIPMTTLYDHIKVLTPQYNIQIMIKKERLPGRPRKYYYIPS